jgi:Putative lumazine-binding
MTIPVTQATIATNAVLELLSRYFDALYRSDATLLATVFHPEAVYATPTGGELTRLTMDEYLPLVAARESPASRGEDRTDAVESIEFAGPDVAAARVRASIGERRYTDLVSLVRVDDEWRIIAKVFSYTTDPPTEAIQRS